MRHTERDMVETIVGVCGGGRVQAVYLAAVVRPGKSTRWVAGVRATTAATGWHPHLDLAAGVRLAGQWYLSHAGAAPRGRRAAG